MPPGDPFWLYCDFGVVAGCIGWSAAYGNCVPSPPAGTVYSYTCQAPMTPESYPVHCTIGTCAGHCATTTQVAMINVVGATTTLPPTTTTAPPTSTTAPPTTTTTSLACGVANSICGRVVAAENPMIVLPDIPIELRDNTGARRASIRSAASGTYNFTFTGVPNNIPLHVIPLVEQNQAAAPFKQSATVAPNGSEALGANFQIRGVPGTVTITSAAPGTFVLLTPTIYSGANPPVQIAGATAAAMNYYTGATGLDQTLRLSVPGGFSYFVTCWEPPAGANAQVTYIRKPTSGSQQNKRLLAWQAGALCH